MNERKRCPECESFQTGRLHTEWQVDAVIEVRGCNHCGAEYENRFGNPVQEVTHPGESE